MAANTKYSMLSSLPSNQNKQRNKPPVSIALVARAVRRAGSAIGMLIATSPFLSNDDKQHLINHMKGINTILADISKRSVSISEGIEPLDADSGDESVKRFMADEKDTLTGIVTSTLNIAGKLRANNRMTEEQYQKVVRYYKAILQMNDAIARKLEIATK